MQRDDLAQYLESLECEDCYGVERVLKTSAHEVTQVVRFIGANGASGQPLVRKLITRESDLGVVYERLFEAQQAGHRFKYIPGIHECYERDGVLVVVMEYVQGETLQDYVYRHDPSLDLACLVFPWLCDAVAELHDEFDPPIIHRDLKPSNIMLSDAGLAIIDFGIAREYREGARADTVRFGTRAFAPPEQFGFGQTSVRSDVYALGVLLYFCLTESIPDATLSPSDLDDVRIPHAVRAVISQAVAFDPAQRFSSTQALKAAFLNAVGQAPVSAPVGVAQASRAKTADAVGATSVAGRMRNGVIVVLLIILLVACVNSFVNPTSQRLAEPAWFNAFGYLFAMPLLFCFTAFVLSDKTWLKRRIPSFADLKTWHWVVIYLAFLGMLFVSFGIAGAMR